MRKEYDDICKNGNTDFFSWHQYNRRTLMTAKIHTDWITAAKKYEIARTFSRGMTIDVNKWYTHHKEIAQRRLVPNAHTTFFADISIVPDKLDI